MSEKAKDKLSTPEKISVFGRNVNMLGSLALIGAIVLVPGPNVAIATMAAFGAMGAGSFELLRQTAEKSRKKKERKKHPLGQ